jgi:hypothetical protein
MWRNVSGIMKSLPWFTAVLLLSCALTAFAQSKGKGKKDPAPAESAPATKPAQSKPADSKQDPWVGVTISTTEKEIIQGYVKSFDEPAKPGRKPKTLPPGLQKKVARGGSLPPGWEKKIARGEVMTVEVFKECTPLPKEILVKLPPPPKGVITVTIEGKVVRLMEATREILDVFEVGR